MMNRYRMAALLGALALAALSANATEVTFSSTATTNSTSGATKEYLQSFVDSNYGSTGGSAEWISFDPAGIDSCGGSTTQTVNKTQSHFCGLAAGDTATFTQTFTILGSVIGNYNLAVLADDTTSVTVNSNLLEAQGAGFSGGCAASGIGCSQAEEGIITIPNADLNVGSNILTFTVLQGNSGSEFGLEFDLNQTAAAAPEPATLGLVGFALLGVGLLRRFRLRVP
jgi:hypothetical protein